MTQKNGVDGQVGGVDRVDSVDSVDRVECRAVCGSVRRCWLPRGGEISVLCANGLILLVSLVALRATSHSPAVVWSGQAGMFVVRTI